MKESGKIRVLVLGLIRDGDRILVAEGYDPVKQQAFYRALGGGIDFGETSFDALKREFQEELQAELANIRYLGCLENRFVYNGQPGHEIIQLYQCDFVYPKLYQVDQLAFHDDEGHAIARWVDINRFKFGELRLVPEAFLEYVDSCL